MEIEQLPETIYLINMGDGWAWCDVPSPDYDDREAVEYKKVRKL